MAQATFNAQVERVIEVPEKVWDDIVELMAQCKFNYPDDPQVLRVMQFIHAED